ncbi:MAG: hypothetical protein QOF57_1516, partial [Frankiaceae bacterium]|nr:hypothetical protein [Frankiaceae bacterium]
MSQVRCNISTSVDGFVAGTDPGPEDALGKGGMQLHEWIFGLESWRSSHGYEGGETGPDDDIAAEHAEGIGASIMGRGMFGGGEGPWGPDPWTGWWGDDPPFHTPVFVLTHHDREPLEMEGGTTFTFVTDGIESAVAQARAAAGDRDVGIGG